jgi:hypothetical protein
MDSAVRLVVEQRWLVEGYAQHPNDVRLHGAIG